MFQKLTKGLVVLTVGWFMIIRTPLSLGAPLGGQRVLVFFSPTGTAIQCTAFGCQEVGSLIVAQGATQPFD